MCAGNLLQALRHTAVLSGRVDSSFFDHAEKWFELLAEGDGNVNEIAKGRAGADKGDNARALRAREMSKKKEEAMHTREFRRSRSARVSLSTLQALDELLHSSPHAESAEDLLQSRNSRMVSSEEDDDDKADEGNRKEEDEEEFEFA